MQVHHDGGGGITRISEEHLFQLMPGVTPLKVSVDANREFTFELYGLKDRDGIVILESGFSAGYPGTGPAALVKFLERLGVPYAMASEVFRKRRLTIELKKEGPELV